MSDFVSLFCLKADTVIISKTLNEKNVYVTTFFGPDYVCLNVVLVGWKCTFLHAALRPVAGVFFLFLPFPALGMTVTTNTSRQYRVWDTNNNNNNYQKAKQNCKNAGMQLPRADGPSRFREIQDILRPIAQKLSTHLHVWSDTCSTTDKCGIWVIDQYSYTNDEYRSGWSISKTSFSRVVLCQNCK